MTTLLAECHRLRTELANLRRLVDANAEALACALLSRDELLAALKEFIPRMDAMFIRGDYDERDEAITRKLVHMAKLAIKRAEASR